MPSRPHPIAGRLLAVGLGLAIGIALVEAIGRLTGYLPPRPSPAFVRLTSSVGWLPQPGSRLVYGPTGEFRNILHFNALGFRSRAVDFPPRTGPDDRHLLVLGDSYTAAWQVALPERWTEQMMRFRPTWTTVNTGVPTWGTDREYLAFVHYPLSAEPDTVLLAVYPGNDPSDTARLVLTGIPPQYPHFAVDGDAVDGFASLRAVNDSVYQDPFDLPRTLPFPAAVPAWLDLHSATWRAARDLRAWTAATPPAATAGATREDPRVFDVFRPPSGRWDVAWQLTRALLEQLAADARRRGVRLMMVLVPYFGTVQPELLSPTVVRSRSAFDLGLPYRRFAEMARALDVPVLDLTPGFVAFRASDAERRDLFFAKDKHFTPLGNCVAAVLVTNWLDPTTGATVEGCAR